MSINVGFTVANPVNVSPSVVALSLNAATHSVTGTSNNEVSVNTTLPTLGFTEFPSQVGNDVISRVTLETLSVATLLPTVTFTPIQGDVEIDANTESLSLFPLTPLVPSSSIADWATRSTASGVTFARDFTGANDFVSAQTNGGHIFAGSFDAAQMALVVKDTTDGLSGGCCLRIDSPADIGGGSAAWMFPLSDAFTQNSDSFGSTPFYIQFRFKIPPERLVDSPTGGNQKGWKWFNIAQYSPTNTGGQSFSNTFAEHVLQDTNQRGLPQAYHRDTSGNFPPFQGFEDGQITLQTAVDKGSSFSGGDRYCHFPNGTPACSFFPTDEWMTFMVRIEAPSYDGSSGNIFDLWFARAGEYTWTHLFHDENYEIGDPDSNGGGFTGINGGHFLTFETNRVNPSTVASWQKYDQVIVSTQEIAIPSDDGIGVGTPTVPAYFPAEGDIVQANTNTVASLQAGDPSGLLGGGAADKADGIFNAWNGGAFASLKGSIGSAVAHGGGHDTYYGPEPYFMDFETRLWGRESAPINPASWSLNYTFGELSSGVPMTTHTYDHVQYWPNGGTEGEFLLLWHTSNHELGGGVSNYTHHYDIATGAWRRQSGSVESRSTPAESTSAYDASRDVFWGVTQVSGVFQYDPNTENWSRFNNNSANLPLGSTSDIYPAGDVWVIKRGSSLWGIDLTSPSTFKVSLTQSGSGPSGTDVGFEWVPILGEFASFDYDNSTIWFLKPPAGSWSSGTWVWRSESLSGSVPDRSAGQNGPLTQFRYISTIPDKAYFSCTDGFGDCWVIQATIP